MTEFFPASRSLALQRRVTRGDGVHGAFSECY